MQKSYSIKDFISSLKKNIRNKIANKWAEMRQPPSTVQKAFKLASDVENSFRWLIASIGVFKLPSCRGK